MRGRDFFAGIWVAAALLLASCGRDGIIEAELYEGGEGEPSMVTGAVLAPNGALATHSSFLGAVASAIAPSVYAMDEIVQPIGEGEVVALMRVSAADASDGVIEDSRTISTARTNRGGRFVVPLVEAAVGECGLMLKAGRSADGTLTRAFVCGLENQNVSAVSEAVVRRILAFLAENPGRSLCAFSASEIEDLTLRVDGAARHAEGSSAADLNDSVEVIAAGSPAINAAVQMAGSF